MGKKSLRQLIEEYVGIGIGSGIGERTIRNIKTKIQNGNDKIEIGKKYKLGRECMPVVSIKDEEIADDFNCFAYKLSGNRGALILTIRKKDTSLKGDKVLILNNEI
ncbi:MAG: hypothetical protein ACW98D_19400, partial [Promethearchaeota archaeon]